MKGKSDVKKKSLTISKDVQNVNLQPEKTKLTVSDDSSVNEFMSPKLELQLCVLDCFENIRTGPNVTDGGRNITSEESHRSKKRRKSVKNTATRTNATRDESTEDDTASDDDIVRSKQSRRKRKRRSVPKSTYKS